MFVWLLSQSRSVFPDCLFIPVHSIENHPPDIVGEAGFLLHGDEGVRQLQRPFSLGILPSIITQIHHRIVCGCGEGLDIGVEVFVLLDLLQLLLRQLVVTGGAGEPVAHCIPTVLHREVADELIEHIIGVRVIALFGDIRQAYSIVRHRRVVVQQHGGPAGIAEGYKAVRILLQCRLCQLQALLSLGQHKIAVHSLFGKEGVTCFLCGPLSVGGPLCGVPQLQIDTGKLLHVGQTLILTVLSHKLLPVEGIVSVDTGEDLRGLRGSRDNRIPVQHVKDQVLVGDLFREILCQPHSPMHDIVVHSAFSDAISRLSPGDQVRAIILHLHLRPAGQKPFHGAGGESCFLLCGAAVNLGRRQLHHSILLEFFLRIGQLFGLPICLQQPEAQGRCDLSLPVLFLQQSKFIRSGSYIDQLR